MSGAEQSEPGSKSGAFDVVLLAASLGGLSALSGVLSRLPADFPSAIVVLQHLGQGFPASLAELLAARCGLPVRWMREGEPVRPGHVYVVPPGSRHIILDAGQCFRSCGGDRVNFVRPAADVLLIAAASSFGRRSIAVILTGAGRDGALGALAVKMAGGRVLAQSPESCEADGMPTAAMRTGSVDFVLSPRGIADALIALVMAPGGADLFAVKPVA